MIFRLTHLPVVLTVATTVATLGVGQLVSPAAGQTERGSVPDLSGIWNHGIPGFEPLSSGPTALINRSRRPNGGGDLFQLNGDYTNPILKPEAAEIVKKHGEIAVGGKEGDPNVRNQCWPQGVPFVFTAGPTEILQKPNTVVFLYSYDHQARYVRMNQQHPAHVTPSWYGDSVGHYEGDTLVVDTVGVKHIKYSMVDWYGTPYTESVHVVERYRILDAAEAQEGFDRDAKQSGGNRGRKRVPNSHGKFLQLRFTVEDSNMFTTPWTATMTYESGSENPADWVEDVCAENREWYTGKYADVPEAKNPDF